MGGFAIGLVILAFFLNRKNASCSYFPDARVLKNINSKPLVYDSSVLDKIKQKAYDSVQINQILQNGDVDFSRSDTRRDSCKLYVIEGEINDQNIALTVENCEKQALLKDITEEH